MAKHKITPFKSYETALRKENGATLNEQHIRLARSLLISSAYKDLGKNEVKILNAMKLIAKGETDFEFSCSLGVDYLGISKQSEKSVRNAIQELTKHGFIRCICFSNGAGHVPNKYQFSSEWIKWKKS